MVLTGSSSIRFWGDVQSYFPEYNVVNNGFGGSHFSDLLYFYDELITRQLPDVLFIYGGDNDVAEGKSTVRIYMDAKLLVKKIQKDLPHTKVIVISPKPSIARWHLKNEYDKINTKLNKLCAELPNFEFANVWEVMLDEQGSVLPDVFSDDGLHMNKNGYDLWGKLLETYCE